MAIQLTDKIHTVTADIDTANRGSAQANAGRAAYTLQDVKTLIGGGGEDTNLGTSNLVQTGTSRSYTMTSNSQSLSFFSTFTDPVLKINSTTVDIFGDIRLGASIGDAKYLTISVNSGIVSETSYEIDLPALAPSENQYLSVLGNVGAVSFMAWTDPASKVNFGTAPASATSTGAAGDVVWTVDYIYVCTATDTWKRVAIATW
jgi:hypothetical protein